jgi:hypothetical protein
MCIQPLCETITDLSVMSPMFSKLPANYVERHPERRGSEMGQTLAL